MQSDFSAGLNGAFYLVVRKAHNNLTSSANPK